MADEKPKRGFWGALSAHPILLLAIGAIIGAFGQDFTAFLGQERATRQKAIENSQSVNGELNAVLRLYAQIASGKVPNSENEIERLRTVLTNDRQNAANIVSFMPTLAPAYKSYEKSIVSLLKAAEEFDDARDAPDLTEAVSEYLYTREKFSQAAIDGNGNYLYGINPVRWLKREL